MNLHTFTSFDAAHVICVGRSSKVQRFHQYSPGGHDMLQNNRRISKSKSRYENCS